MKQETLTKHGINLKIWILYSLFNEKVSFSLHPFLFSLLFPFVNEKSLVFFFFCSIWFLTNFLLFLCSFTYLEWGGKNFYILQTDKVSNLIFFLLLLVVLKERFKEKKGETFFKNEKWWFLLNGWWRFVCVCRG